MSVAAVDQAQIESAGVAPGTDTTGRLPHPGELAALGTVLCLHRARSGGELGGWAEAVSAAWHGEVESDGLRESLSFRNPQGQCCWRLYLLPDSDFLAWDRITRCLPRDVHAADHASLGMRLWQRLGERLSGDFWRASALRLHVLPLHPGSGQREPLVLAASLARLSSLGARTARRIAHWEGAELEGSNDECCCRQAARSAQPRSRRTPAHDPTRSGERLRHRQVDHWR